MLESISIFSEGVVVSSRLKIAVFFGSSSTEHDVSVVSAQQVMDALDPRSYEVLPVYIDFQNRMMIGEGTREIARFRPSPVHLREVFAIWGETGPVLRPAGGGVDIPFDCALPVFHGAFGEDGKLQGVFEFAGIPFTGFRATNAAVAMRKDLTKIAVRESGVNVLPHLIVTRNQLDNVQSIVGAIESGFGFPVIIKPASLGSSIGVGQARNAEELFGVLSFVLANDAIVLVEPRVANLVEYNVAVRSGDQGIVCSAIERPKSSAELLDFREKYLSGSGGTKGSKTVSQGMLSLTRELNPDLPEEMIGRIHSFAKCAFGALGARGAPRIDFLSDSSTGEVWFNEINPIPGSYGFFLWENAPCGPLLFPDLLESLVNEALRTTTKTFDDPVPRGARLLPR